MPGLPSLVVPDAALQGREHERIPLGAAPSQIFTFDDHQAATAQHDTIPQPNRIRAVRGKRWKYAAYIDPTGRAAPEYELYDLEADPDEALTLVDKDSGRGRTAAARTVLPELREALTTACHDTSMDTLAPLPSRPG